VALTAMPMWSIFVIIAPPLENAKTSELRVLMLAPQRRSERRGNDQ